MIAKLTGLVDDTGDGRVIVDVGGVGYLVFCSSRTLAHLAVGEEAALHIETQIREDAFNLFGFADRGERDWFRLLITVQGVGAKHALAILSVLQPDELVHAIAAQDKTTIARAQGVGPKLAGRIAAELKDKIGDLALGPIATHAPAGFGLDGDAGAGDAISVLVNLGYRRTEAHGAVVRARRELGPGAATEDLVKSGLKDLAG